MKQSQKIYKRNIKLGISNKRENCHWIARVFLNSYNDFILLKFEIFAKARTLEYIAKRHISTNSLMERYM